MLASEFRNSNIMYFLMSIVISLHGPVLSVLVETQQLKNVRNIREAPSSSDEVVRPEILSMNIAFDLPDITTSFKTPSGTAQLEAYKSIDNSNILKDTTRSKTSQLLWVSVGLPNFILTQDQNNATDFKIFHISGIGFSTYVEMMTLEQRQVIATAVRRKYQVNISDNQVVHLVLSQFKCTLWLYDETNKYMLNGEVKDFRNFPLRMDFEAPPHSKERELFVKLVSGGDSTADLQFACSMKSSGKLSKLNALTISADKLKSIGLEEKLFGPAGTNDAKEVYVTKNQMTTLSHEMYSTLNIVEEYEMPEFEFSESFVKGLISQLASDQFASVPIDTVFSSLSKYGFDIGADLNPDVIKEEMGKFLKVRKSNSKEHIVLDEENYSQLGESNKYAGGLSGGGGMLGMINVESAINFAKENSKSSESKNRSLHDQLRELNTASIDEAQWTRRDNSIVPKSLNIARLMRSKMKTTLIFNRIRMRTFKAPFQSNFAIYTRRSKAPAVLLDQLSSRVADLRNITNEFTSESFRDQFSAFRDRLSARVADLLNVNNRLASQSFREQFSAFRDQFSAFRDQFSAFRDRLSARVADLLNLASESFRDQFSAFRDQLSARVGDLLNANNSAMTPSCPSGFNHSATGVSKCYAVVSEALSWDAAQTGCKQLHRKAHLVVISSLLENQILIEILKGYDCSKTINVPNYSKAEYNNFWTSGRQRNDSCNSTFTWNLGNTTLQSFSYTNWAPGEPNCFYRREHCVSIPKHGSRFLGWNDNICSWPMCSVCQLVRYE